MPQTRQSTRRSAIVTDNTETQISRPEPPKKRPKVKYEPAGSGTEDAQEETSNQEGRHKGKRKAKNTEIDTTEFLPRLDSLWKIGAHVSSAGGVENAVTNAASIGANAFALFVKSQRKWESPPLKDESISEFKKRMKEFGYGSRMVLPHGSYLINLGNPDADKREKSYVCFLDDLKRCEALGLELYNFHPGSTVGGTSVETSLGLIADCINRAHKETTTVTAVLENMAGAGNIIGSDFLHLAGIIERVNEKTRVGVCLDTCHSFAAGYDIRTKEGWNATLTKFDEQVGLKYLCGMHLNDSKTACNSKKDRHENIGLGHLGLEAFRHILTDPRTQNIPLILETPTYDQNNDVWGTEVAILNRVSGAHMKGETELDLDALVMEAKTVTKNAENKKGGGKAKANTAAKKPGKVKPAGSKRKRKGADESEEAEEDR